MYNGTSRYDITKTILWKYLKEYLGIPRFFRRSSPFMFFSSVFHYFSFVQWDYENKTKKKNNENLSQPSSALFSILISQWWKFFFFFSHLTKATTPTTWRPQLCVWVWLQLRWWWLAKVPSIVAQSLVVGCVCFFFLFSLQLSTTRTRITLVMSDSFLNDTQWYDKISAIQFISNVS